MQREEQPSPGWYPDPDQPGNQRYWDGSSWTEHVRASGAAGNGFTYTPTAMDRFADWWREHWKGPVIGAIAFLIGVGVGLGGAETDTTTVRETETIQGEVQTQTQVRTQTRTVQAPAVPAEPSPNPEPSGQGDGTYTVGEFTITDVQVSEDAVGDFEVRARVTNNGDAAELVDLQATLFNQGSVVSDLEAIENFESGQTRTVTFIGTDAFESWDEIEFTVDVF